MIQPMHLKNLIIFKEPLAHSLCSKRERERERERERDEAEELLYAHTHTHTHTHTNERTNEREGNTFLRSARLSFFSIFEASREFVRERALELRRRCRDGQLFLKSASDDAHFLFFRSERFGEGERKETR